MDVNPQHDIRIDPHIAAMYPQPSPSEYDAMERRLRMERCPTPIHVWAGCNILLDDPVCLAMCHRQSVPFAVEAHLLADRPAAEAFVAAQLLMQRNLSPEASAYYRGKRYLDEKRRHGGPRRAKGPSGQPAHLKTAERLGKEYAVDERTIRRDAKFARAVDKVAANCGPRATQAILAHHTVLRRRTVLRLARLSADEQQRIMQLVSDLGHMPRGAVPTTQRTMVVPLRPNALCRKVFKRLGKNGVRKVIRTLRRLLKASRTTASSDTFTYTIADGYGGTSSATVVVFLADRAPVALAVAAGTHSAAVTIPVLAEDYDLDGDTLTVTAIGTPTSGTAVLNADNTVTYTPNAGTTASTDSFSYAVSDGHGGTSTATVTVQLADRAPTANSDYVSTHSAAVTVAVLANDSDLDGDRLTVTAISVAPVDGTTVINADNTVTYTPNAGTTASTDSFVYTVSDGHGGSSAATVYVQLADQAPVATTVAVSTHSAAVTIAVLAGDGDPDGDKLTVTAVGTPANGTAVVNADNTVTYTPNSGTTASTDSFTYPAREVMGAALPHFLSGRLSWTQGRSQSIIASTGGRLC